KADLLLFDDHISNFYMIKCFTQKHSSDLAELCVKTETDDNTFDTLRTHVLR
ncbi:36189_t:CDS:2, partial [Racocetra persica]